MRRNAEEVIEEKEVVPYQIRKLPISHLFSITLSEQVEDVYKYAELAHTLRDEVGPDDLVHLHISNYGGSVDAAALIVNAIKDCKGVVRGIVHSPSCSSATIIALACDELEIKPFSYLMFHNFSTQIQGKAGEIKSKLPADTRHVETMMRNIYTPFLTKKEIDNIFDDRDLYVHWDDKDMQARLERHHAARQGAAT